MPVENTCSVVPDQAQAETTQAIKYCSSCSYPLVDSSSPLLVQDDQDSNAICIRCRNMQLQIPADDALAIDGIRTPYVRASLPTIATQVNHVPPDEGIFGDSMDIDDVPTFSSTVSSPYTPMSVISSTPTILTPPTILSTTNPVTLPIHTHSSAPSRPVSHHSRKNTITNIPPPSRDLHSSADPLLDITHIRMRPRGHHCLYPGAVFQGTQKSGRNSYGVSVNIVDVDFSSSFLCGYLCIRGLTDDWPELTTYFDAEIIGSRYGFLTQNWGANDQDDMIHWQRFPAFRHVKNDLKQPNLTISDRDRGAVFMRWKERFLVPDHKVHDITGASFAGFYYVCVDFNPQPLPSVSTLRPVTQSVSFEKDGTGDLPLSQPFSLGKAETIPTSRKRRDSSVRRGGRGPSVGPRSHPPPATMSGFYFHQNSEPYQQLSLSHIPERFSSSFEFR